MTDFDFHDGKDFEKGRHYFWIYYSFGGLMNAASRDLCAFAWHQTATELQKYRGLGLSLSHKGYSKFVGQVS